MIAKMKQLESWCNDYCKKHKASWEHGIIANDAWLDGYRRGIAEASSVVSGSVSHSDCTPDNMEDFITMTLTSEIEYVGQNSVEVEFKDGSHQYKAGMSDETNS